MGHTVYLVPSGIWTRIKGSMFDVYQNSGQALELVFNEDTKEMTVVNEDLWKKRAHRNGALE